MSKDELVATLLLMGFEMSGIFIGRRFTGVDVWIATRKDPRTDRYHGYRRYHKANRTKYSKGIPFRSPGKVLQWALKEVEKHTVDTNQDIT